MYGDCSIDAEVSTPSPTLLPILSDDETSIIISHPEIDYFQNCRNDVLASSNNWFKACIKF